MNPSDGDEGERPPQDAESGSDSRVDTWGSSVGSGEESTGGSAEAGKPGTENPGDDAPSDSDVVVDSTSPDDPEGAAARGPSTTGGDEVYASDVEGKQYRGTWYLPLDYDALDRAPSDESYPEEGTGGRFRLADLPRVPKVSHVVGPSAIMLGASLGSGETLFWPSLTAQYGWAVYWAFVVGVATQFVVNTELQRWTLATGESVFRAFARLHNGWPWVFLLGGLLSLGWPGWAAGAAQVATTVFGLQGPVSALGIQLPAWKLVAVGLMVLVWLSYQLSSVMYNVVEAFQIGLLFVAVIGSIALAYVAGAGQELANAGDVVSGFGRLPPELDLALFLGGLAFAGAGGYLNLSQSLWMREKGYGMGNYQGRVRNPLRGDDPEPIRENGFAFPPSETNLKRWRGWWRVVQLEHLLTFVVGLLVGATLLMAVAARYASGPSNDAIRMWLVDVAPQLGSIGGGLVIVVLFVALFTTEYAIVESFVRNSADAIYEGYGRAADWDLSTIFWRLLTGFCLWGIVIILVFSAPFEGREPFFFLVVGAALSGIIMWPYITLTLLMNTNRLPEHLQPGWPRVVAMWWASGFYGYFSILLVGRTLGEAGIDWFATTGVVVGSAPGGYLLWGLFLAVETYAVVVSIRAKRRARGTVTDADEATGPFAD
jgi:hypothetical protein